MKVISTFLVPTGTICLVFILFSLSVFAANSKPFHLKEHAAILNEDSVLIKINLKKGQTAWFYFNTELYNTEPPVSLSATDRIKKFNISGPTLLIDANYQIPFLVYPGEVLTLAVNREGLPVLSSQGNQTRSNELRFFVDYFNQYKNDRSPGLFTSPNSITMYGKGYDFEGNFNKATIDSLKRVKFYNSYKNAYKISNNFSAYVRIFFHFLYINDVLKPISVHGIGLSALPAGYIKLITELSTEMDCDTCLNNEGYRKASIAYGKFLQLESDGKPDRFSLSYDTISSNFSGRTRRYVLYRLLKNNLSALPPGYENKYENFVHEKADLYSDMLTRQRHLIEKFKADANADRELTDIKGNKISWKELLKNNEGNLLYVDFWASWCAPCRRNMVYSRRLMEQLKNKKMRFVFISVDKQPANWLEAMRNEHLDVNRSYLLNEKNSQISDRFKIKSIPRYMIINSNGEIIDDSAPYPMEGNLMSLLTSYLNNADK